MLEGEYVCDVKDKFKISTLVFTHKSELASTLTLEIFCVMWINSGVLTHDIHTNIIVIAKHAFDNLKLVIQ